MKVEQANGIAMNTILEKIGFLPVKQDDYFAWYHSPFCKEKIPVFQVDKKKNTWHDFGVEKGGTATDFVCAYLQCRGEGYTLADAIRWLHIMLTNYTYDLFAKEEAGAYGTTLEFQKRSSLKQSGFLKFLNSRGVSSTLAKKYLKEVRTRNVQTGKFFSAIGMKNENGGYELMTKVFNGHVGPRDISFIRGSVFPPQEIHVFKDCLGFLSALSSQGIDCFEGDAIVLNSLTCLGQSLPYIREYGYRRLNCWLDNDDENSKAGAELANFAAQQVSLLFCPMNKIYAGYKDVNSWHMAQLGLKV